jgi:hypothetical protein
MDYNVGQILYIVFSKDNKVIPGQVYEEITKKTFDGIKIDYNIRIGGDDKTTMTLEEIDGEVFETPDVAIEVLSDRAKKSIVKLVNSASEKAKIWYSKAEKEKESTSSKKILIDSEKEVIEFNEQQVVEPTLQKESTDIMKVKLPDGTFANVKMPVVA